MALFFACLSDRPPGRVRPVLSSDRRKRLSTVASRPPARAMRAALALASRKKKSAMPGVGIAHETAWSADE
ncbi:hypothetical protein OH687_12795 [Burkholderia anthina]|nr:hypothetical protein OH687_12795 [Burkholderia anthina]